MGLTLSLVSGVLRKVPLWTWVVAAVLVWGGWQRHRAEAQGAELLRERAVVAQQREAVLQAEIAGQARVANEQGVIADEARKKLDVARADARRASAAAAGLRGRLAAADSALQAAAASGDCAPAVAAAGVRAELLGRLVEHARNVAEHADAATAAGTACERAYEAVRAE